MYKDKGNVWLLNQVNMLLGWASDRARAYKTVNALPYIKTCGNMIFTCYLKMKFIKIGNGEEINKRTRGWNRQLVYTKLFDCKQ